MHKIFAFAAKHKFITFLLALAVIGGGYYWYKSKTNTVETRYILGTVTKGTLITSISGSGQISVSNQVDIKTKVSGDVLNAPVKSGQEVNAGTILAYLDSRDAQKAVRDAQANLDSAKLSLSKLIKPADPLAILQAENSLAQAVESKQKAADDLDKSFDDGFNTVSNAFLDLPSVMSGLNDILFANSFNISQANLDYYAGAVKSYDDKVVQYRDDANNAYQAARLAYDKNFQDYKSANRSSATSAIEYLIVETYDTSKSIAEAVKNANNLIQFYQDKLIDNYLKPQALANTHLTALNTYTGKTNSHLLNLLSIKQTIQNDKDNILNSSRTIAEKTEVLADLKNGAEPLDIQSQQLAVKQKENALLDAREKFSDYFIRAPFDGVAAKINIKKGDSLSSGAVVATLITKQRTAETSLNEIDVAKIKMAEKATLTFDAIDGLSIAGEVAEIDTLGTVTQGVVTYNVKIIFDTQDDRIKPGMSVSAAIITNAKQDILLVPASAVKTQNNGSYVEMFDQPIQNPNSQGITSAVLPRQQPVEAGLSNDTQTEIISGLKEGDQIVIRTITSAAAPAAQAPSLFGNIGGNRGGGGSTRMPAR